MYNFIIIGLVIFSVCISINKVNLNKAIKKIGIYRRFEKDRFNIDENIVVETVVENANKFPIKFLIVKEVIPHDLIYRENLKLEEFDDINQSHTSNYYVPKYSRKRRFYNITAKRRGVYLFGQIDIKLGDFLSLMTKESDRYDFQEIIVYPKVRKLSSFKLKSNSLLGDNIVKRWIFEDPLYLKGMRDYRIGDRMKDIHWKTSLKTQKLMVKENDFTADKELIIMINVSHEKGNHMCLPIDSIDRMVEIAVAMANVSIKGGVPVDIWTNAYIKKYQKSMTKDKVGNCKKIESVLEFASRIDKKSRESFSNLLKNRKRKLKRNSTYIVIGSTLDVESIEIIKELSKRNIPVKIFDISDSGNIPMIKGVEIFTLSKEELI